MPDFARSSPSVRRRRRYPPDWMRSAWPDARPRALHDSPPSPLEPIVPERSQAGAAFQADLDLVRRALGKSDEAFAELALRLRCVPRALHALSARLGRPFDHAEIEDLTQDALLVLWRKLEHFSGEASLETWAYGVARLEFANAARRAQRRGLARQVPTSTALAQPEDPSTDALDLDLLHEALEALEPAERAVIRLKHFDDLTFEAIAAVLSVSANTAKTRYYRGMKRLQSRLQQRLGDDA